MTDIKLSDEERRRIIELTGEDLSEPITAMIKELLAGEPAERKPCAKMSDPHSYKMRAKKHLVRQRKQRESEDLIAAINRSMDDYDARLKLIEQEIMEMNVAIARSLRETT